jgi:hypothetical protein
MLLPFYILAMLSSLHKGGGDILQSKTASSFNAVIGESLEVLIVFLLLINFFGSTMQAIGGNALLMMTYTKIYVYD